MSHTKQAEYEAVTVGERVCHGYRVYDTFVSALVIGTVDDEKMGRVLVVRIWRKHKGWHVVEALVDMDFTFGKWRLWRDRDIDPRTEG